MDDGSKKVSPMVEVPGIGMVYKMRLIAECSASPDRLPLDRLQRVRHRATTEAQPVDSATTVGLYDHVAVFFVDSSGVHTWHVGQVLAMTKVLEQGRKVDYYLPVSLVDADESVKLLLKYYKQVDSTNPRVLQFGGFEGKECDLVPLTSVICRVMSLMHISGTQFEMSSEVLEVLTMFIDNTNEKILTNKRKRQEREQVQKEMADEGRVGTSEVRTKSGRRSTKFQGMPIWNS